MTSISAMKFYVIEEKYDLFTWYIPFSDINDNEETRTINPATFCIDLLYTLSKKIHRSEIF